MAVAEDSVSVTEGEAREVKVKDGLEEGGDSELSELQFGTLRDVRAGMDVVVAVWRGTSGLEKGWYVAENNEVVRGAGLTKEYAEAENSAVNGVRGDGESLEGGGRLVAVE